MPPPALDPSGFIAGNREPKTHVKVQGAPEWVCSACQRLAKRGVDYGMVQNVGMCVSAKVCVCVCHSFPPTPDSSRSSPREQAVLKMAQ